MSKHKKHKNPNQNININEDPNSITTEEEIEEVDDEMEDNINEITENEFVVVEETTTGVTELVEEKPVEVMSQKIDCDGTIIENYYTVATSLKNGKFINKCGNFVTRDQAIKKANSTAIKTGVIHHVYDPLGKIIFTTKTKLTLFAKKKRGVNYVNRNFK